MLEGVSKPWDPRRKTVAVRPSRIRREPVRLANEPRVDKASLQKAEFRSREREIWGGVVGVVVLALGMAALTIGLGNATLSSYDPVAAAAQSKRFGQCYNTEGPNCVLDGETIRVGGVKIQIAGLDAPQIQDAHCAAERNRGIDASVRLADLLNSGAVTVGDPTRDEYGREVRKVQVDGRDVSEAMIESDAAGAYHGERRNWCNVQT